MRRFIVSIAVVFGLAALILGIVYAPEILNSRRLGPLEPQLSGEGMVAPILGTAAHLLNLPAYTYLLGLDSISYKDAWGHSAYLLGEVRDLGWWYYFPVAFLVKTPVSVILSGALAVGYFVYSIRRVPIDEKMLLLLVAIPAVVFTIFCMKSHVNIGLRHLLPIYAFLYVIVSYSLVRLGPRLFRRGAPATLAVLLFANAMESLSAYPNYLSFFNVAAGGPGNGPHYLLDSNLDWGQDALKLGRYLDAHKIGRVCICYFGTGDLGYLGVHATNIPDDIESQKRLDCVAAISATPLFGLYVPPERFRYFRAMKPFERIGYSIYLYDVRKTKP